VATWIFSPIKFQADMGVLLAFMFVWNMVGALLLLPALAYFLLPARRTNTDAETPAEAVDVAVPSRAVAVDVVQSRHRETCHGR
jgi:hypothetical protein